MASLQLRNLHLPYSQPSASPSRRRRSIATTMSLPKKANAPRGQESITFTGESTLKNLVTVVAPESTNDSDSAMRRRSQLHLIADAAAGRAEMHAVIGEQRSNWNALLLNSLNSLTLFASVSAGLAVTSSPDTHLAFKLSSLVLYSAATAISLAVNYLQPSQLAEEQRNAARLCRQLEMRIRRSLATRTAHSHEEVEEASARVLAIDKAYPLALLGVMLDKFPKKVEPAVWWPERPMKKESGELDETMRGVAEVLKRKDTKEFLRLAEKVLRVNKMLAVCGPLMTVAGAVGAVCSSTTWGVVMGVMGGALAAVVNTVEHGGQVGMVFELYRNCAGYYRHIEEEIEEGDGGELVEMKVALQLGRTPQELSILQGEGDYAGKLF